MTKYAVTGATGALGSSILHHLLHTLHIPASSLIVSLHNPAGLSSSIRSQFPDLTVRQGDYLEPSNLPAAFAGADKLVLGSYPSIAHDLRVKAHKNAIDAARQAGVKHIVYTSLAFAGDSKAQVMQAHIDTEAYLKKVCQESGITYTIVREGIYQESYPLYLGFLDAFKVAEQKEKKVVVPAEGRVAWVARDDLGEGTARILVDESGRFENKTVLLSGDSALSFHELAELISKVWGWQPPLKVDVVSEDEWVRVQTLAKTGREDDKETAEFLRKWATTYPAVKRGELDVVDPLLQELVGRKLKSMEETLRDQLNDVGSVREAIAKYAK